MLGKYLVFESPDNVGKTTMVGLTSKWLESLDIQSVVAPQPGTTELGKRLREIIKHDKGIQLGKETESMIFMLDHVAFVESVLTESLNNGKWVLSDRHDFISGLVYQGLKGVDPDRLESFYSLIKSPLADIVFILNANKSSVEARAKNRGDGRWDRYESNKEYMNNVYDKYSDLTVEHGDRIARMTRYVVEIDANGTINEVFGKVQRHIKKLLNI